MGEEVNIEELKKLTVLSIDGGCPYIGYGEKTIPLMKALFWNLKNNICYDILRYEECTYLSDLYWPRFLAAWVQSVILYLDEDNMDDFITVWKQNEDLYITIIIAILPKREEGLNRRKKAIANLHKLYDARMEIYLVDEELIKDESGICREIRQFMTGLKASLYELGRWSFEEYCRQIFEGGFIYYAEGEDYQFEKAFNVQSFIQNSHLSNNIHERMDNAIFIILCSYRNDFETEYFNCLGNQISLLNVDNEIKWDVKLKDEKENENFRCCAFFTQDKFPEYLEKE